MWEPLSNYQVTHMAAADEGRIVVISTRRVDDSVLGKPKPEQGALWLLDTRTGQLTGKFEPVPLAKGSGPIVAVGDSRVVGWTENPQDAKASILYAVDVKEPRLLYRHDIPFPLPVAIGSNQQESWDFRLGPDGRVWTFIDGVLVQIEPTDGTIQVVGRPSGPGRLAFVGDRIYIGGTTAVRRIKRE